MTLGFTPAAPLPLPGPASPGPQQARTSCAQGQLAAHAQGLASQRQGGMARRNHCLLSRPFHPPSPPTHPTHPTPIHTTAAAAQPVPVSVRVQRYQPPARRRAKPGLRQRRDPGWRGAYTCARRTITPPPKNTHTHTPSVAGAPGPCVGPRLLTGLPGPGRGPAGGAAPALRDLVRAGRGLPAASSTRPPSHCTAASLRSPPPSLPAPELRARPCRRLT